MGFGPTMSDARDAVLGSLSSRTEAKPAGGSGRRMKT